MILLLKQNPEATDGVIRKAVRQPARFCIPLLRPHRHPRLPERLVPPRAGGLLFPRRRGCARGRQNRAQPADRRVSALGRGVRSQSPDPIEWAQKGVRKEDYVRPWFRRMERASRYGVYFIFQSMEQGATFRCSLPKFPTQDPNHRILRQQRSRYTHYYFYLRDETLGPMVLRVASFFPFP